VHLGTGKSVELLVESKTTGKVTHTEYEQDVGEDGSDHTGLYNIDISLDQCEDSNQKLDYVTESQRKHKGQGGHTQRWRSRDLPMLLPIAERLPQWQTPVLLRVAIHSTGRRQRRPHRTGQCWPVPRRSAIVPGRHR
jgi:hypothetical protein